MPVAIAENLALVGERIARAAREAGRAPEAVRLIAVSKTQSAAAVAQALSAGQYLFGENRVQEALDKRERLPPEAQWHLIGHLQGNKARHIPGRFAAVHSLDSPPLALTLQRHADAVKQKVDVFIQLNLDQEPSKSGVSDQRALEGLVETVLTCPALTLRGLMTIPDPALGPERTRRHFANVRTLQEKVQERFALGAKFCELSMGMSHDYLLAIAEGATMVRVGTAIFGERPPNPSQNLPGMISPAMS